MKKNINDFIDILKEKNIIIDMNINEDIKLKEIESLTDSSKEARAGSVFICKGTHFKISYIEEALKNGAICYITQEKSFLNKEKNCILVSDIRKTMSTLGNLYYENAWKSMIMIGITGTKGKSTTAYMLKNIIDNYAVSKGENPAGILSSIENFDGKIFEESHLTTPEPLKLHWHFNNMKNNSIKYCIMEVSSQALKYERVSGIEFDIGCFLNIGEDHISDIEHVDYKDYFMSKAMILDKSKHIILSDSINFDEIGIDIETYENKISKFGNSPQDDYKVLNIIKTQYGFDFQVSYLNQVKDYSIGMGGKFNIYNALAAIAIANRLGIPEKNIYDGLANAKVSGRMELFTHQNRNITIIVDYAHNKLSFEKLFESVREEYPGKKVITIFGCPGGKAFTRRKDLGEIAGDFSDLVIITEEDHAEENLDKICNDIKSHAFGRKADCLIIKDRNEAITKAFSYYNTDFVILITGKGRETTQKRGSDYIDTLSDVSIVQNLLNK